MTEHTIETVTFRLADGATRERFVEAARAVNDYLRTRPGFVARRLSVSEDGLWIEHIEWTSLEHAKAAAAGLGAEPGLAPFLAAIDGPSATMHHTALEIALDRE